VTWRALLPALIDVGSTLTCMAYTTLAGRQQLLDSIAGAIDELGFALTSLGEAYEHLDEHAGERLEAGLFSPVRTAYGRAQRVYSAFAERSNLPGRTFETRPPGAPSGGAKGFIESAVAAVEKGDGELATLQDSMLPVEVGDEELRAGIADVREHLGGLRGQARELVRVLGR
jgi:hypothetical protein